MEKEVDVDADNFDMLNLWHACLAGNSMCITAALLHGHKLRYSLGEGWRSIPCTPQINYKRRGISWTDKKLFMPSHSRNFQYQGRR